MLRHLKYTLATLFMFLTLAQQSQAVGPGNGGGGGGIQRQGRYLTFGSASYNVNLEPLAEVPGLGLLEKEIKALTIHSRHKGRLLSATMNIGDRSYYAIQDSDLSAEKRKKLVASYTGAVGSARNGDKTEIYAITNGIETYLLPEFFKLETETQKAAILLHESAWILGSESYGFSWHEFTNVYNFIIDIEIKFQRFIETKNADDGQKFYYALSLLLRDPALLLRSAIEVDRPTSEFKSLLVPGTNSLPIEKLLGSETKYTYGDSDRRILDSGKLDKSSIKGHLFDMISQYPNLKMFKAMLQILPRMEISPTKKCSAGTSWGVLSASPGKKVTGLIIDTTTLDHIRFEEGGEISLEGPFVGGGASICFRTYL